MLEVPENALKFSEKKVWCRKSNFPPYVFSTYEVISNISIYQCSAVAVCGKEDHDRPRQSQVQLGTARYSAEKTNHVLIF